MADTDIKRSENLQLKLKLKYTPWLYILDLFLRIACLCLYLQNYIPVWLFVILQATLFVILAFYRDSYYEKMRKIYNKYINPKYSLSKIEIYFEDAAPDELVVVQLIVGFGFSFWFMYHVFDNHSWYMYFLFFLGACFGAFIFLLIIILTIQFKQPKSLVSFKVNRISSKINHKNVVEPAYTDTTKQYPDILLLDNILTEEEIIKFDSVDYNDTQIAKLESELKNINYKVEAYLLESVFLGGLAFSGFLTVASANFLGREPEAFRGFIDHMMKFSRSCKNESFTIWFNEIQRNFFRNDLYILIMLLCLMTSVFFLLVLTLRLRLNSLSLNMDHLIRIMTVFNAKEEELYNLQFEVEMTESQSTRLKKISKKIDIALSDANKLLGELKPTVTIMSIYRNIALFLFYLVLIISGFYFMPMVATVIFILAAFTQVFRWFETYSKLGKIRNLLKKH